MTAHAAPASLWSSRTFASQVSDQCRQRLLLPNDGAAGPAVNMDRLDQVRPVHALGHVLDRVGGEGARELVTQHDLLRLSLGLLRALLHLARQLGDGLLEAGDSLLLLLVAELLLPLP